ncbi:anthranilate synthase component 2/putative glutamine amidotransferase [Kitasatospora gansuensis]|uniref:Anthranilate synthase component 2/putative glutamine amidotransferase n=1 Tax=Kitasatospora gansuensis TaxID=258050 RepID=A0A7W7WL00_9ACTN|nr:gamma-glutamyl-gamma-aminobutyrate hydrolase family protein [Kitasatospora gansuensis]MBB4951342.1 anthranilate synthase component 2/putative glutamine amidotransferase [Kitasatospora gansuensis]
MTGALTERPLIGVSSYRDEAAWGVWRQPAALIPQSYVEAVERAGGLPVLLPPQDPAGAARVLARLDGLVLAGGPDLDPAAYGAEPHPRTGVPQPDRDGWEFALARAALDSGLPLLGVCRGMQLLNVVLGGDLVQHLDPPDHQVAPATFQWQEVATAPGSRLAAILGSQAKVRCYHHQAVGRPGEGLAVTARSTDGTVEGLELPGERFVLGVQWHPETDPTDPRLFQALIKESTQ